MPKFIPYDHNQDVMVVINYQDQLQPGTFEHAIHFLIENKLDLSCFDPHFKNDTTGRPAYDPAILLKIILFAYSKGITSSREIEWCCRTNIIFKALSCDTVPHFTTIANFVSQYTESIVSLFEQVIMICDQQGLLGHELFAIDGCKMSSDASKEWSGTFKELAHKRDKIKRQIRHHLNAQQEQDKSETRDDVRQQRTAQAIETLNQAAEKIDQFLKTASPRMGQGKRKQEVKSNITDNESAKMTTSKGTIQGFNGVAAVDKQHQIIIDAQAFGEGQEHHTLKPVLEAIQDRYQRLHISDNLYQTGIIVTADTGFANEANMQYLFEHNINGYIPDNQFRSRDPKFSDQKSKYGKRHQHDKPKHATIFSADAFDMNADQKTCRCPAGEKLWLKGEKTDSFGNQKLFFEGRLSRCRQCHLKSQCMRNPASANTRTGNGRQVSFIIKKGKHRQRYTDWMKQRVDSEKGKLIYSHRMSVVEPVFGNIGTNKRLNQFSLRGKKKVDGQWKLYYMVHNIEKLANYGNLVS